MELTKPEKDIMLCLLELDHKCEKCSFEESCVYSDEYQREATRILIKLGVFTEKYIEGYKHK